MASESEYKSKITELTDELKSKDKELSRYKLELNRANEELEKIMLTLGQELKMAQLIQKALAPTEIPNISGMEFSTKFIPGYDKGGDYFDIFEHDDRMKFGVIMSCSSGYAMSALFLSVLIKLSSQIEARKGSSPDKVLLQMAKELVPNIEGKDTASVFYAVVDRRSFEFQYCSVGAMMGFLQQQGQEGVTKLLPSTGTLKKGFAETPLSQTIQLNSRDRLILCAEGVFDAKNSEGESFGVERLLKTINRAPRSGVHELRNEILFQVQTFSGESDPVRDQTVIVVEVKDRVIKLAKN